MRGVCVLRGVERGPIYSSKGRFPPNAYMECDQEPWQLLLLEMHLDTLQARFGRPPRVGQPHLSAIRADPLLGG